MKSLYFFILFVATLGGMTSDQNWIIEHGTNGFADAVDLFLEECMFVEVSETMALQALVDICLCVNATGLLLCYSLFVWKCYCRHRQRQKIGKKVLKRLAVVAPQVLRRVELRQRKLIETIEATMLFTLTCKTNRKNQN